MRLALIAAHDPDLVIGKGGALPWHFREDMLYFKSTTMGHPVLMGRGVFDEIGRKPLPGRRNLVLTRKGVHDVKGVEVCRSIEEAFERLGSEPKVFVIGGGEVYRQTIDRADQLYITEIHRRYGGDTFFPEYRDRIGTEWKEAWRESRSELDFVRYERV